MTAHCRRLFLIGSAFGASFVPRTTATTLVSYWSQSKKIVPTPPDRPPCKDRGVQPDPYRQNPDKSKAGSAGWFLSDRNRVNSCPVHVPRAYMVIPGTTITPDEEVCR